ncbi:hypothetical protein EW093_13135 [Thiospirochaeta perfilievii]|uniref:Glycosyltransferase family 1 protein n=1 Tax=Thiospirochaeta perfilievii TaxID=252967 RepID=A0A5C1QG82_9SPIO|nr:glycosyltransferase family 4 protein [Thiospirochaeta perfilievii]QEN05614.1 hypothetical protein EW093_13135 [Thiospirochaeta perfilievii]
MFDLSKTRILYLTAGEIPSKKNLIYSQVIKMAMKVKELEVFDDVCLFSFIPIRTILASYLRKRPASFKWYKDLNLKANWARSLMVIDSVFAHFFKDMIIEADTKKLIKKYSFVEGFSYIIHCRSYIATDIALKVCEKFPDINIKVLFDMRSILPPELYYSMGKLGDFFFVKSKIWERELLMRSDLSLLTTDRGIEYIKLESPFVNLKKINILGFDTDFNNDADKIFEHRWNAKNISYIGSIGLWHPLKMIENSLIYINNKIQNCHVSIVSSQTIETNISISQKNHDEIMDYYNTLLAIVIPGKAPTTYFDTMQMSINLFSTKASEALSMGVPIIVNETIVEVANLVRKNNCGIVFRINKNHEIIIEDNVLSKINNKDFWYELTKNAHELGTNYTFKKTLDTYLEYYKNIDGA